ncbi:MAG TPA: uroporphyrinogen decarboxylase [Chloroflexi bacterium]|nr:uroporphyrinogen decarboxylase [Chloroflexota bacterium]
MTTMTKRERVLATLAGEPVDKIPYGFWGHHPPEDETVEGIVKVQLDWHRQYDMDFMKVMFRSTWCLEDWGCEFDGFHPEVGYWLWVKYPVQQPHDWGSLAVFEPSYGAFGEQLEVLRLIKQSLPDDAPILATLFSPLMVAAQLAGDRLLFEHLRNHPEALHEGLQRITRTMERFTEACFEHGADGVFYATQYASYDLLTVDEYAEFGTRYDKPLLDIIRQHSIFTMLHLHGRNLMFDLAAEWPIHAVNWYDRDTSPTLAEGRTRSQRCVIGGVDHERTLVTGSAAEIAAEVHNGVEQCAGRGMMIGPGCAVLLTTPSENLHALKQAVVATGT